MIDIKGVYRVRAKGRIYIYAWKGRGAPRLHAKPGTPAFIEELAAALASRKTGDKARISGLCAAYRASDLWKATSPKTKASWAPWLDRIQKEFGELRVQQFNDASWVEEITAWRDRYAKTPRAADMGLQVLSRLLTFGMSKGRLERNIAASVPKIYTNDRAGIIWTDDDLAELEKFASKEVMWAARLAIYTGLRQGDVLRLARTHVKATHIEVRTQKTGSTAIIPLHGALRALLEEIPRKGPVILTNTDGRPWRTGFGSSWGKAVKAAKIDKHFHDLRGTAVTKLYLAGLKIREIAEIIGWSEDSVESILKRYVSRDAAMLDMIRRLDENERGTEKEKPLEKPSSSAGRAEAANP
jgi:integrase